MGLHERGLIVLACYSFATMRESLTKKQKIIQQERKEELKQLTQRCKCECAIVCVTSSIFFRSEDLKSSVKKIYHIVYAGG